MTVTLEGSLLATCYKISRIIKSLQYVTEKSIVRIWNEEMLNNDFVNHIKEATRIEDMINDTLIVEIDGRYAPADDTGRKQVYKCECYMGPEKEVCRWYSQLSKKKYLQFIHVPRGFL